MVNHDVKPRDIITKESIRNAFALDMAMGGSTNTVLHTLAIAHEANIDFDLEELNEISKNTPYLCKVSPATPDVHMEDVDRDEPLETVINFQKKIGTTYPLALDPGADIFGLFAVKKSGVTRNVVIDHSGKIVFLTRLFDEQEYKEMIQVIKQLI